MTQDIFKDYRLISQFPGLEYIIRETDESKHVDFLIEVIHHEGPNYLLRADNSEHEGYEELSGQDALTIKERLLRSPLKQVHLVIQAAYVGDSFHPDVRFLGSGYKIIAEPSEDWNTPEWDNLIQCLDLGTIVESDYGAKLVLTRENDSGMLIHYKEMEPVPET